ncbi:MAG: serine/threonine protein phosphatase [Phormidesmis sp. RL_2_1]|nr:serine/threonine protein phosphatase [Phormidesmis sp. RL_2_1]
MSRRIFIGDIHGHYDGLMTLVSMISPTRSDTLHFVGDLIDRGPKSSQVVDFVRQGNYPCVLGNHEHLLLNAFPDEDPNLGAFQGWLNSGGQPTLTNYPNTEALLEHVEWMKTLPLYLDLGDIFLVHAGLDPRKALHEQTRMDFCWIRDVFHRHPKPAMKGKRIITGHTITFTLPGVQPGQIAQGPGWLDIDTGAYHPKSGWLTAVDMDHFLVYQVNTITQAKRMTTLENAAVPIDPTAVQPRSRRRVVAH